MKNINEYYLFFNWSRYIYSWLFVYVGIVGFFVYVLNMIDIVDGYMCFNDSNYILDVVFVIVNILCFIRV